MYDHNYAVLVLSRGVHVYDYLKKTLLFKISCNKVKKVYLLEEEQILAIRKDNDQIELYSIQQMA